MSDFDEALELAASAPEFKHTKILDSFSAEQMSFLEWFHLATQATNVNIHHNLYFSLVNKIARAETDEEVRRAVQMIKSLDKEEEIQNHSQSLFS